MKTIVNPPNNVILFPTTIAFYERQLTKYLETERYKEAVRLLTLLVGSKGMERSKREEWTALLSWLQTMFPETTVRERFVEIHSEEEDDNEEEFVKRYVASKKTDNRAYGIELLELLRSSSSPERQLMALDQLVYTEQHEIDRLLVDWLAATELHPMVQFKTLQTLKKRGYKGRAAFSKLGEKVEAEVEATPLELDQFPDPIRDIIERVEDISEVNHPDFPFFAKQTWLEFLAYAYGTPMYRGIAVESEGAVDAWAAALHRMLLEVVFGEADEEELADQYGITEELAPVLDNAYSILQRFGRLMMPTVR